MFGENGIFAPLQTADGAVNLTIVCIILLFVVLSSVILKLPIVEMIYKFIKFLMKFVGRFVNKKEKAYHRDLEIGKITEKRTSFKLYNFLSELIIDLNMKETGMTPYGLLFITLFLVFILAFVVCQLLLRSTLLLIVLYPILVIAVFCIMYTKANIAHDARIESVIEAENIICNNIKSGVVVAVRDSLDVLPKSVRPDFKDFVDNVEQKNYHIKTALLELNSKLGSVADDFIKKCIVFELEEEHGVSGMFSDIVEINNINMEMRIAMKRKFEEVKFDFIMGAGMIFAFLFGVLAIFPDVRTFYFTNPFGNLILALDALLFALEFVYITYLRAQEL